MKVMVLCPVCCRHWAELEVGVPQRCPCGVGLTMVEVLEGADAMAEAVVVWDLGGCD